MRKAEKFVPSEKGIIRDKTFIFREFKAKKKKS
jgi:hypothetical protein